MAQKDETQQTANLVGAIDIGSNSIRMLIAQVLPDGQIETLESLQRPVRLGQDTFRREKLSGQTMRAAVAILRDFRRLLDSYGVRQIRTVATSAVREARNSDTFLDRILMATGLDVAIIDTAEESRLTVAAVRQAAGKALSPRTRYALIAEVGGGSSLLTLLEHGEIDTSISLRLGSIRLQESLATSYETPARSAEMLKQRIHSDINAVQATMPMKAVTTLVAVGGDARFTAAQIGKPLGEGLHSIPADKFVKLVERCTSQSTEELMKRYGLPYPEAETLNPALLIYDALLRTTRARRMIVTDVSMRDGLLLDVVRSATGQEDQSLTQGVLHSAATVAEKYRVDAEHARHVGETAVRLFDELAAEHGLSRRHRLLLQTAAMLHEAGSFISNRSHHKHSYYVIANSEVFGLTRNELEIVAQVARYHRQAMPKPTHLPYMALPRETRMVISKLAALLRVADALDQSHQQRVREVRCHRSDEELSLQVVASGDLTLEAKSLQAKGDLFEEMYGLKVHLEDV
ncbi:MAG: Ppx/GppA family phosphatase [Planctomycetes bacterium]|nr:Ppx/GppA family phosphatase [Planctomycetota bacterium]